MAQLTKNFTSEEFECKCGECSGGNMNAPFMTKLQKLRENLGIPLTVTENGGFRCFKQNKKAGGKEKSMHLLGRAADLAALSGVEIGRIVRAAIALDFRGIGVGKTFVHVDNRESAELVMWTY